MAIRRAPRHAPGTGIWALPRRASRPGMPRRWTRTGAPRGRSGLDRAGEIGAGGVAGERTGMRFGIFLAPYHAKLNNPTLALERDIQLIEHLDQLGYDEAWIGEHHSGGAELITAPDLMIAAIAERTRHISLGTGVYSLGYHHPMSVAERMVLLDHLTRGRIKLGVGPGALATDAFQRGYDPRVLRQRMAESLDAIVELLRGEGPVNRDCDWFTGPSPRSSS